jgi:formylglycine-generating enzyme required for sulfatase activity
MKFVPLPGTSILMCIHETRKRDYAAYAAKVTSVEDTSWKNVSTNGVPVSAGEDDPVVNMTWNDAKAFCAWLSKTEGRLYRLPTDAEWSLAVGLAHEVGSTIQEKERFATTSEYPWGRQWPPPKGAGNFADAATKEKFPSRGAIAGYSDGFATTAPVMSFQPNRLGIFDLAGNALEWCEDVYNEEEGHVLRGSGWLGAGSSFLRSSYRYHWNIGLSTFEIGFRCVVEARKER